MRERGVVQQGRKEQHEDQVGRQLDVWQSGQEPDHKSSEYEQNRVGDADRAG
ncbi:MAG: hypothetical protein M3454_07450 [Actinomycetota bacterium]|nr:hypothetical protein [Actinomycetota bacterium]